MATTWMDNRARSGMVCSECNDLLVAPEWSAYVSNHEVRHVWFCENCGHDIEMAVNLRFDITSAQSKRLTCRGRKDLVGAHRCHRELSRSAPCLDLCLGTRSERLGD